MIPCQGSVCIGPQQSRTQLSLIRTKKDLRKKWSLICRSRTSQRPGKNVEQLLLSDWDLLICDQYNRIFSQLKLSTMEVEALMNRQIPLSTLILYPLCIMVKSAW